MPTSHVAGRKSSFCRCRGSKREIAAQHMSYSLNSLISIVICMWNNASVTTSYVAGQNRYFVTEIELENEAQTGHTSGFALFSLNSFSS